MTPHNAPPQADAQRAKHDTASKANGRFAYEGLERAIHEKARLGIMTSLATHAKGLLFVDLKELCNLTDGNLSRHLQVLHDEGLIEIWKGTHQRRPQTLVRLTESGRSRFCDYLSTLEQVIADALNSPQPAASPRNRRAEGWSTA